MALKAYLILRRPRSGRLDGRTAAGPGSVGFGEGLAHLPSRRQAAISRPIASKSAARAGNNGVSLKPVTR